MKYRIIEIVELGQPKSLIQRENAPITELIKTGLLIKELNEQFRLYGVSGSLPSDDRIVAEAIQAARKVNTEVGLLPNNNDIRMFCLGAKWMRDFAHSNDR